MPSRRRLILIALMSCVSGCVTVEGSLEAYCDATATSTARHAEALSKVTGTGATEAIHTGVILIRQRDAACNGHLLP